MTFSNLAGLTLATAALFGGTAYAQEATPELQASVMQIMNNGASSSVYGDIDQDGEVEALITYDDNCNVAGCLFSIVDKAADGSLAEVAYQFGEAPALVSGNAVIDANGVFWTWNGLALVPYFDTYNDLSFYSGTPKDQATIVKAQPWMPLLRNYDIQMANVDLFGNETPERFVFLDGPEYKIGQATPYFVFSEAGDILMKGAFIDRPYLFKLRDRNASALVTHGGSGFSITILE
jgi:hypothetical protein